VADVVQQRGSLYHFVIRPDCLCDPYCQVADAESMPRIVSRRFAVQASVNFLLDLGFPRGRHQAHFHWGNYTTIVISRRC